MGNVTTHGLAKVEKRIVYPQPPKKKKKKKKGKERREENLTFYF